VLISANFLLGIGIHDPASPVYLVTAQGRLLRDETLRDHLDTVRRVFQLILPG